MNQFELQIPFKQNRLGREDALVCIVPDKTGISKYFEH